MTRLTEKEYLAIQKAKAQAVLETVDVDRILWEARRQRAIYMNRALVTLGAKLWHASGLGALVCAVKRGLAKRRTLAQLSALEDRQLRDIGIERAEIGRIAVESSRKAHPYPGHWLSRLGAELKRAAARRQTIARLSSLDDRMLQDIGIERATISELVDARMEARSPVWSLENAPADPKPSFTVKLSTSLLLPFYLLVQGAANSNTPTTTHKAA